MSELEKAQEELSRANYLMAQYKDASNYYEIGKKEMTDRINAVLANMDEKFVKEFVREWHKQEEKQKGMEDEYER